ncbi:glycerol-3-phosphate 1-O-acyltransferase PlsY [Hydromonas duriensis]|uniref:Glycerol-3-phosphate acyltransferase n=1 Tax=Hydromonas duriensis TaxID=1527608 RepID=A0A4V3DJP5_9BURK|nr:glycerol-3-phosphate 1-O-acyltransferase PlsY [Hydromonas duriensis]TDR30913.1 acyl-phosphate glycerol-3-phosphate acyltransferase [Hydromonas duriensis]
MTALIWSIAAYLLGSISFAIVLSKLFGMDDPRSYGSNNPGATNMLRSGRKTVALLTLLGDAAKGLLPVVLARQMTDLPFALSMIACAAFLGHLYPIFFKFQGGKGVATFLGAMLGLIPAVGGLTLVVWLIVAVTTRYSSLSSLISSVFAFGLLVLYWGKGAWILWVALMVALLFWRHRSNIAKLLNGTESQLFAKKGI